VRRAARRRLGLLALAGLAFFVTASVVARLKPPLDVPILRPKLEAFLSQKDAIDAVYLGTSRVQRGVDPSVIDARLSSPGREFRSFNLGVAAMESFEADHVLREIVASKPERLRLVVIEAPSWAMPHGDRFGLTERYLDWHDAHTTRLVLQTIWTGPLSLLRKVELSWKHLRLFATRASNHATSSRFFRQRGPGWERSVADMVARQGFRPLGEKVGGTAGRRRAKFLAEATRFQEDVDEIRARAASGALADEPSTLWYDREALGEQVKMLRDAGIEPVYLVAPRLGPAPDFALLAREGAIPHLIDLRDPRRYPELFRMSNHFDREHMGERGARLMSNRIAAQLDRMYGRTLRTRD